MIRRRDRSRGQSVVEFALVLPILLLLLAATIDFGRLFYLYVAVNNAAKEGALYGARAPLCDDDSNPACGDPNNVAWHVANEASNLVDSNGNSLLATTVACRDTSGVLVQPINNCVDGYTYQVTVTSPFTLITPMISNIVGQTIVLRSESQATVISDAFDPTGLEALIWVDKTGSQNAAAITTACIQANSVSSAGYYYQPCQDGTNVDNYLQFQENTTVNYKVRVRNTGNINLTGITYAFTINGVSVGKPGNCSTLPASLTAGSRGLLLHLQPNRDVGQPGQRHRRRHRRRSPRPDPLPGSRPAPRTVARRSRSLRRRTWRPTSRPTSTGWAMTAMATTASWTTRTAAWHSSGIRHRPCPRSRTPPGGST